MSLVEGSGESYALRNSGDAPFPPENNNIPYYHHVEHVNTTSDLLHDEFLQIVRGLSDVSTCPFPIRSFTLLLETGIENIATESGILQNGELPAVREYTATTSLQSKSAHLDLSFFSRPRQRTPLLSLSSYLTSLRCLGGCSTSPAYYTSSAALTLESRGLASPRSPRSPRSPVRSTPHSPRTTSKMTTRRSRRYVL